MRFTKVLLKQVNDNDCGKTALLMLLAYVHNNEAYLTLPLDGVSDNFLSMTKISLRYGVTLSGKKLNDLSYLKELKAPFIAQTSKGGVNHFVFCLIKGKKLLINDPGGETYAFKLSKLNELLFTNVLIVEALISQKEVKAPRIKYRFDAFIWEVLFVLLIGIGFLFMGNIDYSLVSYLSFTFAALCKIIEQQVIIKSLTKFDASYIKPILTQQKELSKKEFESLQSAKERVFGYPLQLFTRLLNVVLITVVLTFNNYYLLSICVLAIIGALVITKAAITKHEAEWKLKNIENKLYSKSIEVRTSNYNLVMSATNKLAKKQIYYTVIALFTLAAFIFFLMYVTKTFSLNYFLFYFFAISFYFNELKKIFTLIEAKSSYYQGINIIFSRKI